MKPKIYALDSGGYEVSLDNEVLTTFPSSHNRYDLERALDLAKEYVSGFLMAVQIINRTKQ